MSRVSILKSKLDSLAEHIGIKAIRRVPLTIDEMIETVDAIKYPPALQEKTVSPSINQQTIKPDDGYDGLSEVSINRVRLKELYVTRNSSGTITYTPGNGFLGFSKFSVEVPSASVSMGLTSTYSGNTWLVRPYRIVSTAGIVNYGTVYGGYSNYSAIRSGTSVTPTESAQTIGSSNCMMESAVTINAIPSDYVGSGIAQRSSSDLTASNLTVTAPSGYYSNAGTKTLSDQNLIANNIKKDVTIFGVTGTYEGEGGGIYQDQDGYLVLAEDGSAPVQVDALNVTTNGTYTAQSGHAYSPVTVNVSGGGSGSVSDPIRFFDYDGTLVASYSSVPSSLPNVPTHTGLTNGTWNHTLAQVTAQFNATGTCNVGANYETSSGKTEIDCTFVDGRLSPYLRFTVNGTVTVDWGDGSPTETMTGTSLRTRKDMPHTYSQAGDYTITIEPASGTTYSMYSGTTTYTLLHKNSSASNANRVYADCVKAVRLGVGCEEIGMNAFYYCYSLQSVSIPSGVTSIGGTSFYYCTSLQSVSIPSGVTSIGECAFQTCYSLQSVSIPSGVTSISEYMFASCYSLQSVSIPSGVTSIGNYAFQTCYSLAKLSFGSQLSSINAYAFSGCYGMAEYHFTSTTPPTLADVNAFNNIQSDCIIYVPSASLSDYQAAENWSTYASYMVGE